MNMKNDYLEFIERKRHTSMDMGIEPISIDDALFDFQKHVSEYAIRKGRAALFLDTGLGKTLIALTIADNYERHTKKPVLIITPIAVAFQFELEAKKFDIDGVRYSKKGEIDSRIVIANYERLHYFNPDDFDCVILDESSILKHFDGKIKNNIMSFLKKVNYRFLCTATPSPNDYTELGNSAEALGHMGYVDMLTKFFTNNIRSVDLRHSGSKWILKPHATEAFWSWVSSWSISMRKPSDWNFTDDNHQLPELIETPTIVDNFAPIVINNQPTMFAVDANSFHEIRAEVRATIEDRCRKAVELASDHPATVYWVNLNDESSLIAKLDADAVEVKGSMSLNDKEDILKRFAEGKIKKLITKPKITGFGLNWQHCNHTVFFPTYSFEQYYQAIRRFWRFGQDRPVTVDLVISKGQRKILKALKDKKLHADEMFDVLVGQTSESKPQVQRTTKEIQLPSFI